MGMGLIPVRHTGHIILPLEKPPVPDTDLLNGHTKILLKVDRILNMPAIKSSLRHGVIIVIRIMDRIIMV